MEWSASYGVASYGGMYCNLFWIPKDWEIIPDIRINRDNYSLFYILSTFLIVNIYMRKYAIFKVFTGDKATKTQKKFCYLLQICGCMTFFFWHFNSSYNIMLKILGKIEDFGRSGFASSALLRRAEEKQKTKTKDSSLSQPIH